MIHYNNSDEPFKILNQNGSKIIIQFINTGSVREVLKTNVLKGKVKDLYAPSVYGVGYLGGLKNSTKCTGYQLWKNMLKRCYTDDPKGYKKWGTTVDIRWHCFENFHNDIKKLENYDKWLENKIPYDLDKDFKGGCNIYSFHNCSFVSTSDNRSEGAKTQLNGYYRVVGKNE